MHISINIDTDNMGPLEHKLMAALGDLAPETPVLSAEAKPKKAAPKPKAEPEPAEAVSPGAGLTDEEPVAELPNDKDTSVAEVQAVIRRLLADGEQDKVKSAMRRVGASNVKSIEPGEQANKLLELLNA